MAGRIWFLGLVLVGSSLGCAPGPNQHTALVPRDPFSSGAAGKLPPPPQELSEEAKKESVRVGQVGMQILAANPQLTLKPQFVMVSGAAEEIFHRGGQVVFITESLSRQCKTDAQLAAVLCHELGKQVSEREASKRFAPQAGRGPPADVRVGNDYTDDFSRLAELGKYENEVKRQRSEAIAPDALARIFLQKAGYPAGLLGEMAPLLQKADNNAAVEKQLNRAPLAPGG